MMVGMHAYAADAQRFHVEFEPLFAILFAREYLIPILGKGRG